MRRILLLVLALFTESMSDDVHFDNFHDAAGRPYEFVVTITYQETAKDVPKPICIGTIVTELKVITSCRCMSSVGKDTRKIRFIGGAVSIYWDDNNIYSSKFRQMRTPKSWTVHESCGQGIALGKTLWEKDFAVVTLNFQFVYGPNVNSARYLTDDKAELITRQNFFKNNDHRFCKTCWVNGYMATDYQDNRYNKFSEKMVSQMVEIISDELCVRLHCGDALNCTDEHLFPHGGFICARVRDSEVKICDGDRGTPLICQGYVYGYFVGTNDCGNPEKPLIFAGHSELVSFVNFKVLKSSGFIVNPYQYLIALLPLFSLY